MKMRLLVTTVLAILALRPSLDSNDRVDLFANDFSRFAPGVLSAPIGLISIGRLTGRGSDAPRAYVNGSDEGFLMFDATTGSSSSTFGSAPRKTRASGAIVPTSQVCQGGMIAASCVES